VQPHATATAINQQLSKLNARKTAAHRPGVESRRLGGDCLADKAASAWKKTSGFHPVTAFADHGADGNGEPLAIVLRNGSACYLRNSAGSMIK
jgi:hypothetical protein